MIEFTIPVNNDDNAVIIGTWGADNFPKAVRAKARAVMKETKEAAASRRAGERLRRKRGQGARGGAGYGRLEDKNTRPKNSRKGDIDEAEAEQYKADRKSRRPKGGAADGKGSQGR